MEAFRNKRIVIGVTGSIAAYKGAELLRELTRAGAEVQVMMSEAATHFIGPLTLEALSGRPVMLDPLELQSDSRIGHIVAADSADAILVAPATARWLGAMAAGLANDIITATCLASSAPVVVAPAMDGDMYVHPATAANVARLREFGYASPNMVGYFPRMRERGSDDIARPAGGATSRWAPPAPRPRRR